jgi:hypothetical protein
MMKCSHQARYFSSSSVVAAREVNRLGVVGAGQMVLLVSVHLGYVY